MAGTDPSERSHNALIFSPWNLLLLVPLLMLITAWFNKDGPRLFGMPFFYWYQFAFVFVGVACVWIVFAATKHLRAPGSPALTPANPDEGDLGEARR
ncbi:DUF3311 domain-containing protein [Nakamurella sp. YIM 132087]|uniref:DUF3311 domain-containing protein n=1 Tax=Nakamurella alba TaxID=2665158 RepID=A0A7K1FF55_9ACTN|nr:DUF3311 domain-containing protein [Nakamurella alba]